MNRLPGLQLLHPLEYLDVKEDEQREGDDDLHDEVHPEDVDPDVQWVGPHAGRLDGVDGLLVAVLYIRTHRSPGRNQPQKIVPDKRSHLRGRDMSGEHARSVSDPLALRTIYAIWAKFS